MNRDTSKVRARLRAPGAACIAAAALAWLFGAGAARADAPPRMSLDDAVATALAHHPRVRAARAVQDEARAQLDEARADQLPSAGLSAQLNRSTGNAVPGTFFPTVGIASISGSPRGRTPTGDTWQSGVALWGDLDVTGFVRGAAIVDAALAASSGADAALRARDLQIGFDVADAFLDVLAAHERVRAAQASVERARTFAVVVKSLVDQSLRPGVDAARVDADVALAQTQVARAEELEAVRRARLAEAVGAPDDRFDVDPGGLLRPLDDSTPTPRGSIGAHPLVQERDAAVERSTALARVARLEYAPRVDLVAALWARGSGYYAGGFDLGAMQGAVPDTPNWGAGIVFTWRLLDLPRVAARSRAADARTAEARARRDEAALAVRGEVAQATAMLEGARRVARDTPVALDSARMAEAQAIARYRAALVTVLDVADAQRVLAEAEIEDALARLEVRRALLYLARATGDLEPFLADARRRGGP